MFLHFFSKCVRLSSTDANFFRNESLPTGALRFIRRSVFKSFKRRLWVCHHQARSANGLSDAFQSSSAISHTLCLNTLVNLFPVHRDSFRRNNAKLHLLAAYAQHLHADVVVDADDFAYAAGEYQHGPSPCWVVSRQALPRRPASETSFRNPDWLLVDDRYRTSVCDCYPSSQARVEICEARVRFEIDDFPRSIAKPEINHVAYLYFTSALCWHLHFSRLFSQCTRVTRCISENFRLTRPRLASENPHLGSGRWRPWCASWLCLRG